MDPDTYHAIFKDLYEGDIIQYTGAITHDSNRSKVNSEKLIQLKQLKENLMSGTISPQDAEKKIVDIKAK
ncbi:hypothetical protein [Desulfosporosinus sp. HMP52]|uniref:hypothetical protein n=1 Tax=Desulfosporosinus sp. HMP52 TaxID=1487923 RepID=UPI000FFEE478|nr:hypothetical protein [Desulfosporosinus sp. HMP52]